MTTITTAIRERLDWEHRWSVITGRAIAAARKARAWRLTYALPGLAGAGLISAGVGLRFGLWAGLIVAGIAALRIDGRL